MIACKICVWLVNGRSDRRIVGGWIYSKPVGWLVCLQLSVDWSIASCKIVQVFEPLVYYSIVMMEARGFVSLFSYRWALL